MRKGGMKVGILTGFCAVACVSMVGCSSSDDSSTAEPTTTGSASQIDTTGSSSTAPEGNMDGKSGMSKQLLAKSVSEELTKSTGRTPDEVRCEGMLVAEPGATQTCALRAGSSWLPVNVTATNVQGNGEVEFTASVGKSPIPEPAY